MTNPDLSAAVDALQRDGYDVYDSRWVADDLGILDVGNDAPQDRVLSALPDGVAVESRALKRTGDGTPYHRYVLHP